MDRQAVRNVDMTALSEILCTLCGMSFHELAHRQVMALVFGGDPLRAASLGVEILHQDVYPGHYLAFVAFVLTHCPDEDLYEVLVAHARLIDGFDDLAIKEFREAVDQHGWGAGKWLRDDTNLLFQRLVAYIVYRHRDEEADNIWLQELIAPAKRVFATAGFEWQEAA